MASGSRLSKGVLCAALPVITVVNACGAEREIEEISAVQHALTTVAFQQGSLPSSSYAGSTDATLRQAAATTNYGGATTCEADGDDGSGVDKSCLLRWSLSGIPAGSTVQSASITLLVTDGSSNTYNLYEVKRSWSESQVTWNNATSSTAWATAGAMGSTDRGSLVGSVTGGTGQRTITLNAAGVALVQAWVDGTSNHGIVVASSSNTNGIDFASSEHATAAQRPKLTITYGGSSGSGGGGGGSTDPGLLVAFIGDQGNNGNADDVLNLIKDEGAAATIHNGDFDYADNPTAWENRINSILGSNYPYFAVIGNHDAAAWGGSSGYASYIQARHARVPAMNCTGELGVKATCNFRGLYIVQSCIGTSELRSTCASNASDQVNFIHDSLANDSSIWSVCAWHKNQHDMQVGGKSNEVGWSAYQECMSAGAFIATGHEHSYSRTLTLTDVGNAATGHGKTGAFNLVELAPNRSFVFVSGLAGVGIRDYEAASHDDDTWWSSYYASNKWVKNGTLMSGTADYGALFIRFNVDGDPKRATAYFKDVNGRLADEFTIQVQ
ncbi:DNRLRE domain-containing protein [Sorangium sp. So ce887]|uniref:DNRLRE domain-containing protein n=1 Tax=Sorangium sp. So ce887 TaxID=3133324 RepID=UPI003F632B9C